MKDLSNMCKRPERCSGITSHHFLLINPFKIEGDITL